MASSSGDDRRGKARYELNVPMQLNGAAYHDVEMIDISATGMQLKSGNHDIFRGRGYERDRREQLKISIVARLAWAEPDDDGGFLTGWEFEVVGDEGEGTEEEPFS
ncbi:MAG: PilZ domain-containing protein, partial [Candidatus Latescibacteria bacterium]|nr:PilZ domain-containing protein [Candidatus Latescibacterota bacterium]